MAPESLATSSVQCKRCGHHIADRGARLAVDGAEEHQLENPTGHVFRVACFETAPGTRPIGIPTRYWTWFPGRRWRRAWCRQCDAHIGWLFESDGERFHALILARLSSPSDRNTE